MRVLRGAHPLSGMATHDAATHDAAHTVGALICSAKLATPGPDTLPVGTLLEVEWSHPTRWEGGRVVETIDMLERGKARVLYKIAYDDGHTTVEDLSCLRVRLTAPPPAAVPAAEVGQQRPKRRLSSAQPFTADKRVHQYKLHAAEGKPPLKCEDSEVKLAVCEVSEDEIEVKVEVDDEADAAAVEWTRQVAAGSAQPIKTDKVEASLSSSLSSTHALEPAATAALAATHINTVGTAATANASNSSAPGSFGAVKTRRVRCGACDACARAADCGQCGACLDKPKFGGAGTQKQACKLRRCMQLRLGVDRPPPPPALALSDATFVQCDACHQWRLCASAEGLPEVWTCALDPRYGSCSAPNEPEAAALVERDGKRKSGWLFEDTSYAGPAVGTVVWAKQTGSPYWPARVEPPFSNIASPRAGHVLVRFL